MIKNNLSRIIGEQRLSMAEVARRAGIHKVTIFKIYHDQTKQIEFAIIDKLCKALKCNTQELFEYIEDKE